MNRVTSTDRAAEQLRRRLRWKRSPPGTDAPTIPTEENGPAPRDPTRAPEESGTNAAPDATCLRVFVGVQEIAGTIQEVARALTDRGHRVEGVIFENRFYSTPHPALRQTSAPRWIKSPRLRRLWQRLLLLAQAPGIIARNDVFVFVWSITLLPANLDLLILRLLGRKVIVFNCGDDARYRPIHDRIEREVLSIDWLGNDEASRQKYVRGGTWFLRAFWFQKIQESTGCRIVTRRDIATFQRVACCLFRFPQDALIPGPKRRRDVPIIVHAPSDRVIKGSKYVEEAIGLLQREGRQFEFRLIENVDNRQVLAALRDADIAIDKVYGNWPGRFGIEAMAAGCVLVGSFRPDYAGYPETPPIIHFEPDSERLAAALRALLDDRDERQRLMNASWEYWKARYSANAFYDWFQRLLAGTAERVAPLPEHRRWLLAFAENPAQRFLIRWFY